MSNKEIKTENGGATIDELIDIARAMGCELHIEFRPKCNHAVTRRFITTPGIEHTICVKCGMSLQSDFFTESHGRVIESVRKVGE